MSQDEKDKDAACAPVDGSDAPSTAEATTGESAEVGEPNQAQAEVAGADEVAQLRAKVDENRDLYLSALADAENIKRRAERDVQNARKFALEKFVNELLPVKDSLEMGLAASAETNDINKLSEGTELTLKMLTAAVTKFGVKAVDPLGDKFNPELHEAIAMQPSTEADPNTVVQVIQKGYVLHDRLVRPAMVIVAKAAD